MAGGVHDALPAGRAGIAVPVRVRRHAEAPRPKFETEEAGHQIDVLLWALTGYESTPFSAVLLLDAVEPWASVGPPLAPRGCAAYMSRRRWQVATRLASSTSNATHHLGAWGRQQLWMCTCARVHACMRACVQRACTRAHVSMRACVHMCMSARVHECMRACARVPGWVCAADSMRDGSRSPPAG